MGVINLAAGATFVVLGLGRPAAGPGAVEVPAADADVPRFAAYAGVALLAGFAMMALQTVLIRLAGLALGSSQFTFSMVVSTFVLSIALGSFAVSAFRRVRAGAVVAALWILVLALIAFYGSLDDAPYWAYRFRLLFGRSDADFYPYYLAAFAVFLAAFIIPIGLSGALLPMLFGVLRQRFGELGDLAGRLYSWNTVGSLLGALVGGYALLFWLDLHHVYRISVGALTIGVLVLGGTLLSRSQAAANAIGGVLMLGAVCLLAPWDPLRLSMGLFRQRGTLAETAQGPDAVADLARRGIDIPFYTDDPAASVAVWERKEGSPGLARSVRVNGKSEGEIPADYVTMSLVALLPALVAESCERSFVIGYGTGVTAGELATLDCARRVEVAEISRGVLEAAPLFDYGNHGASRNSKVVLVAADAYRTLLRADARYDIIASEPSNPWVAGVEMLFSREFLDLARQRLAPGGVFAQWIHLYEIDAPTLELIFHTFASVFERVAVWHMLEGDIVLLGMEGEAAPDLERLERRFDQPDFRAAFARAGVPDFVSLLAREIYPLGVVNAVIWTNPVHTLLRPVLNHQAARAFFRGDRGQLPALVQSDAATIGREQSLLRRYAARHGGSLPDDVHRRAVEETCEYSLKLCVTLMAEWRARDPGSPVLAELLERHLQVSQSEHGRSILRTLVPLFGTGDEPAPGSVKAAEDASGLFVAYYHHAAPFGRDALLAEWQRCPGGLAPGSDCLAGLEEVERHLGPLRH
jgi:spermidine synthase